MFSTHKLVVPKFAISQSQAMSAIPISGEFRTVTELIWVRHHDHLTQFEYRYGKYLIQWQTCIGFVWSCHGQKKMA